MWVDAKTPEEASLVALRDIESPHIQQMIFEDGGNCYFRITAIESDGHRWERLPENVAIWKMIY